MTDGVSATNDVTGKDRTPAEFRSGLFRSATVVGSLIGIIVLIQIHLYFRNTARDAGQKSGYSEGKGAGYHEGYLVGYEHGEQAGQVQAIGNPKPLDELRDYTFLGVEEYQGKRYGRLVEPGGKEPKLYRLDQRQFPLGFPARGGKLKPVQVTGYYEPVNLPASNLRRRTAVAKPISVQGLRRRVITRRSSRSLPKDWPMCWPALPPANPKVMSRR